MGKLRELKKRKEVNLNMRNQTLIVRVGLEDRKIEINFKISLDLVKRFQGDNLIQYIKIEVKYHIKRIEVKNQLIQNR